MMFFLWLLGCSTDAVQEVNDTSAENTAWKSSVVGGAGGCATSCALDAKAITQEEWYSHLIAWGKQEIGVSTQELDTLLFYAKQSKEWLETFGSDLDDAHYQFLVHELSRNQVDIEMRLVDEFDQTRGILDSRSFYLKEKQHLAFRNTQSLGALETGGKVKRVGLAHLWSRW